MESLKAATRQIAKKVHYWYYFKRINFCKLGEGYKGSVEDLFLEIETLKTKNKKMQEEVEYFLGIN